MNKDILPAKKYRKPPASRSLITPEKVERLAATRMPIVAIAAKIGVSEDAFHVEQRGNELVRRALKRGRAKACAAVAAAIESEIAKGVSNVIMFVAKQPPERGGLGFMDERSVHVDVSGEVTVRAIDGAWQQRQKMIEAERKLLDEPVIEAEYSEVQ